LPEEALPLPNDKLVKGNAYTDGAPRGGWFVASFIDGAFGLRCRSGKQVPADEGQADFELKMRRHTPGDTETGIFPFNKTATSLSMLVGRGRFELFFCSGRDWDHVTLEEDGDYALWAPGVGHLWRVPEASTIFTVRAPGIPADQDQTSLDQIPEELRRILNERDLAGREQRRPKV
jgi:hypothetical protein